MALVLRGEGTLSSAEAKWRVPTACLCGPGAALRVSGFSSVPLSPVTDDFQQGFLVDLEICLYERQSGRPGEMFS